MKLVTVATHSERYFPILLESCNRYDIDLTVLGWNQKWGGFMMKYDLMKEYLDSLQDTDIVCFVDAYDVIVLQPLDELERKFISMNANIVVAYDTGIFHKYIFGTCKGLRINSGTYIGYVCSLKQMLSQMCIENNCKSKSLDDQRVLTMYCKNNDIKVDIESKMFFTKKYNTKCKIIDKKVIYNNSYPCILHGPGNHNMDDILRQLGYNIFTVEHNMFEYIYKRCLHHFNYIVYCVLSIMLICLLVLVIVKFVNKIKNVNRR